MKNNIDYLSKFGYEMEFAITPTTLPPDSFGIGGNMICSWVRVNGKDWIYDQIGHFWNISKIETKGD